MKTHSLIMLSFELCSISLFVTYRVDGLGRLFGWQSQSACAEDGEEDGGESFHVGNIERSRGMVRMRDIQKGKKAGLIYPTPKDAHSKA